MQTTDFAGGWPLYRETSHAASPPTPNHEGVVVERLQMPERSEVKCSTTTVRGYGGGGAPKNGGCSTLRFEVEQKRSVVKQATVGEWS